MDIGNKLYELRKSKNLSQEELADKLNVTRQTISKWETNQSTPDFDKIIPLCEIYGISADELLKGIKNETIEAQNDSLDNTAVIDTQYFNSKLGVQISIINKDGNTLSGTDLVGTYYEMDEKKIIIYLK